MRESEVAAMIAKYRDLVRPDDTSPTLAARLDVSQGYAQNILVAMRRHGIIPPGKRGGPRGPRKPKGEPDTPPVTAPAGSPVTSTATEPAPAPHEPRLEDDGRTLVSVDSHITTPEQLVDAAGLDLDRWEITAARVNTWATVTKSADGEPVVTRLWQVRISIAPRLVPLVACDWPPPPVFVVPASLCAAPVRRCVVLPDMQIGYEWDLRGTPHLVPYHDRQAIDAALQIVERERPTDVVLLGDNLDFAALSIKYQVGPSQRQTAAPAIREYRWLLHRLRSIAPHARIVYCEGNHEARWRTYLEATAGELVGLVPTLPALLDLDELGIEWVPYMDEAWLWDRVRLIHGDKVRQGGGATAAAQLREATSPILYGHIHRAEVAYRRITGPSGDAYLWAMSPGCLCRVDGAVRGSTPRSDWQQGVGILTAAEGLPDAVEVVRITRGLALHRGELVQGRDYAAEMVGETGNRAMLGAA